LVGYAFSLPALLADDAKLPQDAADNPKLFEGSWKVVALEVNGRKAPPEALQGMRWSFHGSEVQFVDSAEKAPSKASVKIDPGKTPKHIDLIGLEEPYKSKSMQGIFKMEKGRLVICLRTAEAAKKGRPREFMTEADSGLGMITLERVRE
jgi:uncharacterized protein (TIGR03067 family)